MSDFERPTLTSLVSQTQADINGRVPGADSRLRRSVLGVLARIWSGLVHGLYGFADRLADEVLPDTAKLWLARHGGIWGIPQKAATFATGSADLTGVDESTVLEGTVIQRDDEFRYATTADVTFDGTTATVPVIALTAGATGNAIAATRLSFVSPVSGVNSEAAVHTGGITGGNDIEAPEAWRGRILGRIRKPPQGGSYDDYVRWALEVAGVTRVWVYPRWSGAGTVGIAFVYDGRDDIFPSAPERAAMLAYISARCPVHLADFGIVIIVLTPSPLNPVISLTPDTPEIRAAVTAELTDLLEREASPGGTLIWTHLNEAISLAEGEVDHELTTPAGNVTHATAHMPTLGTVDWDD